MLKSLVIGALAASVVSAVASGADKTLSGAEIKTRIAGKVFKGVDGYERCSEFSLTFSKNGRYTYQCERPFNMTASGHLFDAVQGRWSVDGNRLCTEDRLRRRFCSPVTDASGTLRWPGGKFR